MAFDVGSRRRAARCAWMPQIIFSRASIRDLERLREFLRRRNPLAAKRAGDAIIQGLRALGAHPCMVGASRICPISIGNGSRNSVTADILHVSVPMRI